MSTLQEIVSANVEAARRSADEVARGLGEPKVDKTELSRRVALRLDPKIEVADPEFESWRKRVYDRIRAAQVGKTKWPVDLIEAVASALGTTPARLVSPDYRESKVPQVDRADFLARNLGRRLTPQEVSQTVKALSVAKESGDGSWGLLWRLFDDIRTADTPAAAASAAHDRVLKWRTGLAKALESNRKSQKGK